MNIQVQVYGMFILIILLIFYKSQKTLRLYTEQVFYGTFCIATISLALDILSLVLIEYKEHLPTALVNGACKLYIISLIFESASALSYVLADLFPEKQHKQRLVHLVILTLAESAVVAFLPIHIYSEGKVAYTYGPSTLCVYGFVVANIVATLLTLCTFRQKLNKRRGLAVGFWMFIWITAAIVQYLYSELLIVGFAGVIGVLILFVIMENPEANLDKKLGCFNSYALSEYLAQTFEQGQPFSMLELSFQQADAPDQPAENADAALQQAFTLSAKHKEILVFRSINSELICIGADTALLQTLGEEMMHMFHRFDSPCGNVSAILLQHGEAFQNMDELFRFFSYTAEAAVETDGIFLADEQVVNRYKEQHLIRQAIADALEEDRVEVFFQPIYSNHENRFTSAEALVRIRETNGGLLSPGLFIPIAERSGQILELGERVFEKVCDFLKNSEAVKLGIHYIEVNLSVIQCEREDLADRLIAIIEKYGVDPALINLEITETASVSARATMLRNMNRLIDYGFTFSLDDFGKGESNLMYVVEMPISIIKLDYDMSKAFFNSIKAQHVVRAVVGMAHGMNLKLVAEGIETQEEIDIINQEQIDYIQGYFFAKPLPINEFLAFLRV